MATSGEFWWPPVGLSWPSTGIFSWPPTHAQVVIVANLYGQTVTETLRQAVEFYIEQQRSGDDLTARAQELVEAIERESNERRQAIQNLLGNLGGAEEGSGPTKGRRSHQGNNAEDESA